MLDRIILSPYYHLVSGTMVVIIALLATMVISFLAWKRRPLSRTAHGLLIVTQVSLMLQALIGIKLLDQGMGTVQLYIHYVGGLAPMLFFLIFYWLPPGRAEQQTRRALIVLWLASAFVVMTYTIGGAYARGTL